MPAERDITPLRATPQGGGRTRGKRTFNVKFSYQESIAASLASDIVNMKCPHCNQYHCNKPTKVQRTLNQNSALWKFCERLAEALNFAGKDMRVILKPTYKAWWNKNSIHDYIWLPFQKVIAGTDSTTELKKADGKINEIHETIMRELGEVHGIEYIPWPSKCSKHHMVECEECQN